MDLKELHQNQQYKEICDFWDEHQQKHESQSLGEWEYLYCMNSLYKEKRYSNCLELYKEQKHYYPASKLLQNKMGWCVYQIYLKGHNFKNDDNNLYFRQVDYVLKNCENSIYSPVLRIIQQAVSGILNNGLDYAQAHRYLDLLQPENLSPQESSYNTSEGCHVVLASDQEKWFVDKAKVLLKQQHYKACITCCDQGIQMIGKFHNNEDVWLRQKKVKCLLQLGCLDAAETEIHILLRGNICHWAIWQMAFNLAVEKVELERALKYAGACALADSSHEMRVGFYAEVANFLYAQGQEHEALLHRQLTDLLRQENQWKQQKWTANWQMIPEVAALDIKDILKELKPLWRKWRDKDKIFQQGTIKTILPSGKDGFIRAKSGSEYYFRFGDIEQGRRAMGKGAAVRFTVAERENPKRQRIEKNAVNITVE
jgi:hypothetical protein